MADSPKYTNSKSLIKHFKIGTRGSPLAMVQAHYVESKLHMLDPEVTTAIVPIETTGDKDRIHPLSAIGGKGVFIREIESALVKGEIDMVVGTGSMRRKALLYHFRPDVKTVDIRGNIETRLSRLTDKTLDAILLSEVSLSRLGLRAIPYFVLPPKQFIPAPGQGVIALQTRTDDDAATHISRRASHPIQYLLSNAQLALLSAIGFDCSVPFGMHCEIENGEFFASLFRSSPNFSKMEFDSFKCDISDCLTECKMRGLEWLQTPL
ncbi:hypothetical protein EBR96_09240 [bacterium]|nr:hypothetical protein [bacterium]